MIKKYISELVSGNNRVIIPDFGAFMIQDTPEGKVISFNDFLKFNDGLLVNHIIKNEKVNKNQALDQIKELVKEIESNFSQGKVYFFEGIGELSRDTQGNIKLSTKITAATDGKKITDVPPIVLDEKVTDTVKKTEEVEKPVEIRPTAVTKTEEPVKPQETIPVTPVTPKPETAKTPTVSPTFKSTTQTTQTSTTAASKTTSTKQPIVIKTAKKRSALNTFLVIAACLVIIAAGVWAVLTYHVIDRFMPTKEAVVVKTDTIQVVDTTPVVDTSNVVKPVEEPKVVNEQVDKNAKRFYLIAGSFKVRSNAERFQTKLSGKGFNSQIIERKNGFNAVTIKDFASKNEALDEWSNLKDDYPGTWILIK
jgi:hypothetical protein